MPETRFGPYVLVKRIAVGGMAEVYLARYADGPSDAHVVVKQILPQLAEEPELLQLFIDEARIASRVVHPGIVRVLDVGVEGGVHFLAMEYVDGLDVSLLMRLARELHGSFPVAPALRIAIDLCRGLHHAHEATEPDGTPLEIVHRDVSPQNVLISRGGHVKLTDFGIARASIRARRTATGVLRGKIAYVSPEQYLGDRGDRRVDVYAIGVVLFEMLAGRRPFTGDEAAVIKETMTKDSPTLISVLPNIDRRISEIIARATARLPEQRFRTAAQLADELEDLHLASGSEELGQLATRAILLRDRTRQQQPSDKSSPPKKATQTLSPPSSPPALKPKRTETIPVPLIPAARASTEALPLADTLINPVALDDGKPPFDESDTVYTEQPAATSALARRFLSRQPSAAPLRPPVVLPTIPDLKRPWNVRLVLFSVIAFGFIAGWMVSWLSPSPTEGDGELTGAREVVVLTATTASATVAVVEEEELAEDEVEEKTIEPIATLDPIIIEEPRDLKRVPMPAKKKRVREKVTPAKEPSRMMETIEPPAVEAFGELSLDTDPWSRVRIGKKDLGPTPLAHVRLPVGKHRLVLENSDRGITRTVTLVIRSEEPTVVRVRLSDGQIVKR